MFPSILTLGALLGIVTAVCGLIGLVRPSVIDSRRHLRRFTLAAGVALGLEVLLLAARIAWTPRRTVELTVPSNANRIVRVVYGVRDGVNSPLWRWNRRFVVSTAPLSIVYTQLPADDGWFNAKNPHPIIARTAGGANVAARWISGGYANAGDCRVAYDEFSVGDSVVEPRDITRLLRAGWLDSLSTWGVACRGGHLERSAAGSAIRRTDGACYSDDGGVVGCSVSAQY
jgi:hypothetical protein